MGGSGSPRSAGIQTMTRRTWGESRACYSILLSNVHGRHLATPDHENGWRPTAVRQLGYAPVYVIQFSKISETLPPTPYDENGWLPDRTSNSIHEAKTPWWVSRDPS